MEFLLTGLQHYFVHVCFMAESYHVARKRMSLQALSIAFDQWLRIVTSIRQDKGVIFMRSNWADRILRLPLRYQHQVDL